MDVARLVDRLERLEASGESSARLVEELRTVDDAQNLWRVAESVVGYPAIMGAIYQRASEIGALEDTALGYLALSHAFDGDDARASTILGCLPESSKDPIVLSAWAALADNSEERIRRLNQGIQRCPDALRLWRDLASETLRIGLMKRSREAHLWLLAHEENPQQRDRVAKLIENYGWT